MQLTTEIQIHPARVGLIPNGGAKANSHTSSLSQRRRCHLYCICQILLHPTLKDIQDFPSAPGVKNLPANAGDTGLMPDPGEFNVLWNIHASQFLSLHSRAHEPQLLKPTHPTSHAEQQDEKPQQ